MKVQNPHQPHQAVPGTHVPPRGDDNGTRGKPFAEAEEESPVVDEAHRTEPHTQRPTAPPPTATDIAGELAEVLAQFGGLPAIVEEARNAMAPTYAQRVEALFLNVTKGMTCTGAAPEPKQLATWCAEAVEAIDAELRIRAVARGATEP